MNEWTNDLREGGVGEELSGVNKRRCHGDDNFQPMRELEGVAGQETPDRVPVVGAVVLGLAHAIYHHHARTTSTTLAAKEHNITTIYWNLLLLLLLL